jgi:hypothetical protein
MKRFAPLLIAALALGACGQADAPTAIKRDDRQPIATAVADDATQQSIPSDVELVDPVTTIEPPIAVRDEPKSASECHVEWRTIWTAIETSYAKNQFDVETLEQLVTDGVLRELPTDWTLVTNADGAPVPSALDDGACAGFDPEAEIPDEPATTLPAYPPELTNPASPMGMPCYVQETALNVASNAWFDSTGVRATSQQTLIDGQLFDNTFDLYDIDPSGAVVQQFDGGCFLRSEELDSPFTEYDSACFRDALGLAIASDMYDTLHGSFPPSLDDLRERGYLLHDVVNYELADPSISPVGPLGCPDVFRDAESSRSDACDIEKRTIETAVEAYFAENRVAPTMDDLVPDYLRELPTNYVLQSGVGDELPQPVVTPDGRCA